MTDSRSWVLPLKFSKPLSLNDRMKWQQSHGLKKQWRAEAKTQAREAGIPRLEGFTAVLHYRPRDNRHRDTDNLIAALKPLVDGLVDAGVAAGDDTRYYRLSEPVIHPASKPARPGCLWLVVVDLGHLPGTQTALPLDLTPEGTPSR